MLLCILGRKSRPITEYNTIVPISERASGEVPNRILCLWIYFRFCSILDKHQLKGLETWWVVEGLWRNVSHIIIYLNQPVAVHCLAVPADPSLHLSSLVSAWELVIDGGRRPTCNYPHLNSVPFPSQVGTPTASQIPNARLWPLVEGAGFRVKAGRIDSILVSLCFTSAPQRFQLALSDNSLVPFHLFSHILVYYLSPFWLGRSGANSQLYQGCSVTRAFFLLSWEVPISFSVVRKKRVIVPRRSLLSVRTTFRFSLSSRDFYDNITIDIDSSSFSMPTGAEIKTRGRGTGSLNRLFSSQRRGS